MFLFAFAALGAQAAAVATVNGTGYETLEAAIAAAEPVDGVVTYEICGKAEVSATGWIQVLKKSGLSNVKKVAFVGTTEDAEICIAGGLAILADQQYDIDVSFRDLKLSKPNPEYGGDYGHSTNYFTTWLRNTGAAENTVTYENCTFPNGACNNQYGKTVYTNCTFANGTTGLYNLWIYGGSVEMDGGVFTGTRGMKVYTEGTPATAPSVEVKRTAFSGLTEKAAIVVSKAATVKFAEVSVAGCSKGLFQKDIEGSSDDQKVTVTANGSKISGSFAITANKEPGTAKTEFNITGGMFTAEVPSDYCADGFTVKATTDADGNTVYGVVEKTELVNYVTLELVFGDNVADEDVVAAKALYAQEKYETCKAANEAYMALFGVTWGKGYLDVTDNTAPLYKYAGRSGSVSEVRFYIHGTLAGFTSLQSSGNQIDCTVGGNHQISRTSYSIIGVDGADGKAKLTDGNVQAYVAGGYASMFTASGKLTIDNIEFTSTTSTTVGASATRATESDTENEVASAEMEIKNCTFRGRLYVYDNFENQGKMTYSIHNCVFDGSNYSGDSNAYAIFAQCKGGNNLVIKDNAIAGFARGINIDHANVHATIEGNKISVTDTGRSCIQLSSLAKADIVGNTLELTGGNAITLHEKLLTLGVVPEVSISGNTVTGTGYLIYDDAKANDKEFTSDNLKLTYATDNTVAATVDTTQGVKDATKYELSGTVATTLHSVDFAAFVKALTDAGYTFDGSKHARAQNGKLTVKWSPVSGCYDTRAHVCTVGNVAATANTPKRVNSGLTQFQLFEGSSHAVNVKNVAFVYEPAAFTVCENSGWQGTFTAAQAPAGQIFLMNTGDVTFEGCSFDKVVLTSFNCTGTSTVKNCSFKDVYNSYAVKDIRGATISVTGCTFENCGAAVMVSSTVKVGAVTISGNTFKKVDVAGTTPDNKVGTRGLVQIASSGDYAETAFDFSDNTAEACGPVLRQLNETVSFDADDKTNLGKLVSDGGASTFYTDDTFVAQVGDTKCATLAEAFAELNAGNHTLTLLKENAWDAATPVYWAAGTQKGYAKTLTEALTAAYKANAGAITIVCRPSADVGTMTHGHVADDLTIYGNKAYLSGGECDLEVDQYKYSRATGAQATDGAYLEKDITITAYELDNLGVWGDRHTAHMVTVNLTDCDGKAPEGNVQRVYISGTTGVNDITLTDCDFLTKATAVYSNADGAIKAVNCSFTGGEVPFNINHKANGTQTVAVENCTFTNCGDAGDWKQFAAPLRLVNSGTGTQSAEVTGCAFAGTVGANGDILLGDGRTDQASNDVELKVVNTAANIQAQKPGYYGGETVDATKKATAESPAEGTLETSVAKLLPVDPRTLGYATSGKAEALPATPDMNGEVVNVTAAQAQYVLDGAYGPIDGKTINFTESINDTLILGRASKYDGSKTVYRHGSHAGEALSYADFIAYKNQSVWTESCYYERTVENVTFTANEGVTVKNFEADGGEHIYAGTAPVYDYVRDTGSWVTKGSCYYKRAILKNITFKGLTFKAKTDINTSESTTVYDGFTFKDCTFDLGTTADGNQAIRYYNENNNGNVKNLVVEGCTFKNCSQGVYTMQVKGITVKDSTFTQTGHNAIAIQSQGDKGPCNHGKVVITGNTMVNIGDRAIRFNVVAAGTTITITGNTAAYGDGTTATDKQCIKAESLAEGVTTTVELNNWNNYAVAANKPLTETVAKIGTTDYKSLEDATEAAQGGDVITIVGYTSNMTAPDGWKFETADGVTTLVADPVLLKGADGKFHIASCDDLLLFRKMVNEKGMYFLGETVVLDKDIDMVSVENWTPIGNAPEKKFAGTFDGQNHTISGLKITGGSYVGLFGYLGAATVQNVALVGANVSGVKRVGALVGQIAGNATIKNCSLDATSSVAGSDSNTGGLIGEASGSIVVTLENLTNNAPVTNTESGTSRAAGILCQATSGASVTLKNCVNKGTITTNGGYAGGIVSAKQGGASLVFDGCSNTGTLANGTKGTGALLAWSCNGSSVTISNYSGDVANAIGWLSQDNYDHVFVINGVEHYIRVAKGGSGYTFASRYEAAQLMNKSYLQEIIGFFNYAKTVNSNFEGYPATPVEVLKSAYSTSDESIKGSLFNTDESSGWPQLLSGYNATSGKSLTADDFAVTWGTRDVLFMVSDPVTVVVTDTASAQAALDAATPNTTIIFKSGTYEPLFIRQTLEKSTRRSDLDKDGSYPAYLRSFKNLTLIAEVGAEVVSKGITAEAGLFWHASAPASNQAEMRPMGGFISYLALENVTIDGIAFDSTEQSAVTLRDNGAVPTRGNIMVDGLTIQNCTGRGVASNENIHFLAAGGGTNDQNFPGTEKKSFNNIVVKNCELDSYYQPIAFNNATAVLNGLTVTGNTFSNNGNSNVLQLSNKVNSGAFVIENNLFKDLNGRVVRATNSTANWTITGNRLDKPIMYDDSGDLDLVKISVKAETVGAAVTESKNDWNTGTLANGTYIANGDPALLPVARIGENKYYHSLQAAFDAAKDGETVKLLADVTVAGQLVAEKALTLDLGGKTVTSTYAIPASLSSGEGRYALLTKAPVTVTNGTFVAGQARALGAYANLTLTDATVTSELTGGHCCVAFCAAGGTYTVANATIKGDYAIANFAHNATIAITGSALEGSGCGLYHNGSNYGLKLTVSDTTINGAIDQAIGEGKDPSGVYLSGSLDVLANAENQNGAKGRHQATFTRCTIKGNTGVEVKYTDLTLEDCTVVATTKEPSYTQNNNGMAALGFAVVSTDNATGNATPKPEGTITITGADGSYTGLVGLGSLDSVKTGFADFEDAHYAVSGGTFSNAVLPEYCAAGFIPTANDDGTYGVKAGAYVAAIGTTGYETLEAALAAAQAGETVKMLADVTLTAKQTIAKALVLDLNGKTISSTAYRTISLGSGANVTIRDSSTGQNGKITNGYTGNSYPRTIYLDASGAAALTVESGIVESNPNIATLQSVAIDTDNQKTGPYVITITGGKVLVPESSTKGRAIVASKNTTLNITGGEIVGGLHGVDVYGGSTTAITGGSISARVVDTGVIKAAYGLRAKGKASVIIGAADGTADGVSVAGIKMDDNGYKLDVPAVTVNSGTIAGPVYSITPGTIVFNVQATSEDVLRFADDTAAKFLPSNLELRAKDIDGKTMYYVAAKPVAAIGAIGYETLEAALAAAKDGETVKLLADVTESVTIAADRTLTLDLNGKTLSAGKASEALTVTGHLTIDDTSAAKSGRVVGDGRYAVYMNNRTAHVGEAAVGGSLTLNAGSLEGATHGVYILANQAAFTMNGGKVSATKEESIRVNNDYHAKTISLLGGEVGNVFLGSISSTELTTLTVGKADQTDPAAVKVGKIGLQYNRGQFRLELYNGLVGELPEIGSCTATYTALGMLVKSDANCPSGKVFEAIDYNGETWYRIAALQKIAITFDDSKTVALPFATDWLKAHVGEGEATWTTEALEEKAENELAKWQCYLFGLDPSKEDAKVVATAGQGTDEAIPLTVANADASASPLVTGGYVTVAYVLMGSNDMGSNDGTAWTPVATSDKRDGLKIPLTGTTYKFYRVDVTVTSAEGN